MNAAIILLFLIPAIVTIMLVGLIIKEREYLFPKKAGEVWIKKIIKRVNKAKPGIHQDSKNNTETSFLDFSGGSFGIW